LPAPFRAASLSGRIDTGYLDGIRALQRPGKPDLLKKIIDQYCVDGVRQIELIRCGYAAGHTAAIQGASHRLKSSSANLGALRLAELCEELEGISREGALPADMTLIARIEEGYLEARTRLEELPEGRKCP
jgi:HPt (histidine-containing phosphotransfer) domain-containing protein